MKYNEFSKISIHNHIGGNGCERKLDEQYNKKLSFDINRAKELLKEAKDNDYELLAITNANVFQIVDYLKSKYIAKEYGINIIPGIELNIANENVNKFLHVIVLIDPKSNLIEISNKINESISMNKQNYININQLVEIIVSHKVILIPHGLKQSNSKRPNKDRSSILNVEQFKEIISMDDAIPIVMEDSKTYHKETLKLKLKDKLSEKEIYWVDKSVSVSAADRKHFNEIDSPTYIWAGNSFDDLYFSVLMKNTRIKREEDIITKTSYISKIEIIPKVEKPQINKTVIECSHGLNSIIGKSGSGKTLLLNAIKYNLTGENLKCRTSSISYYENVYKDVDFILYDSFDQPISNKNNWKIFEGENLYNKILQVYSSDKTKIIEELDLKIDDTKFKNEMAKFAEKVSLYIKNENEIKKINNQIDFDMSSLLSNVNFLKENKKTDNSITYLINSEIENNFENMNLKLNDIRKDFELLNKTFLDLKKIAKKYSSNTVIEQIENLEQNLQNNIREKLIMINNQRLNFKKVILLQTTLYRIIREYNSVLGKKIESIVNKQQQNLRIIESIKNNVIKLILTKKSYDVPYLKKENFTKSLFLSNSTQSRLILKKFNFVIPKEKFTIIFENSIGQARNKINLSEFDMKKVDLCNQSEVLKFLRVYINKGYNNYVILNNDYNNYVEYELQLKNSLNNFEDIETMSAGELSKTYINNLLDSNIKKEGTSVIILFDQPDNSLEKKFILKELVKKIDDLRVDYQIFITTHEPLLVVNADSNSIIEAKNEKTAVSSKNKIFYKNLSFIGKYDSKDKMINDIAELVDGSYNAIKDRTKIYGGMLNGNNN